MVVSQYVMNVNPSGMGELGVFSNNEVLSDLPPEIF